MQTFYRGLIPSARETMDAAAGGAFLSLTLTKATELVEKMASNQSWNEDRQPPRKRGITTGNMIISDVFLVTLPRLVTEGYILYDEMSIFVTGMC
jgi:hypothetical protein